MPSDRAGDPHSATRPQPHDRKSTTMTTMTFAPRRRTKRRVVDSTPAESSRDERRARNQAVRRRTADLLEREISFIPHESFADATGARREFEAVDHTKGDAAPRSATSADLKRMRDPYVAALYRTRLLQPEEEQQLFREMNRLKYLAAQRRDRLDLARPRAKLVREIETLLAQARQLRDRIVRANLRLVVSLARKVAEPATPLDELVSEGNLTLMRAVEKFDFSRGFRFSTYATHAVRRNLWRMLQNRQRQNRRECPTELDQFPSTLDDSAAAADAERAWPQLRGALEDLLARLDDREQLIVRARFGLGVLEERQTLQVVAERIGLSKERVRQLECRALDKLRDWATESPVAVTDEFERALGGV